MADLKISGKTNKTQLSSSNVRVNRFRERRLEIPDDVKAQIHIVTKGETPQIGKIKNISEFGARVIFPEDNDLFLTNSEFESVDVKINDQSVYQGKSFKVNDNLFNGKLQIGLKFESHGVNFSKVKAIIAAGENQYNFQNLRKSLSLQDKIKNEFKLLCSDLSFYLSKIKAALDNEEQKINESSASKIFLEDLESQIIEMAMSLYSSELHEKFGAFQEFVADLSEEEHDQHREYFRTVFHRLFLGAPFINRAFNKPLGYAGDYGLMLMFYDYKHLGETLYFKFMHKYACNEPSSKANKNRVDFLGALLFEDYIERAINRKERLKVCSIACGPGKEIEHFVNLIESKYDEANLDLVFIDNEPEALQYAQRQVRKNKLFNKGINIDVLHEDAVLGIIKQREFCEVLSGSDVIVCSGLFDYLSDRVSTKLIEKFYQFIRPGGKIFVGNVASTCPDKFTMDYIMDWNLFFRDEPGLYNMVSESIRQSGAKVEVISEALGLNLFLKIEKK